MINSKEAIYLHKSVAKIRKDVCAMLEEYEVESEQNGCFVCDNFEDMENDILTRIDSFCDNINSIIE